MGLHRCYSPIQHYDESGGSVLLLLLFHREEKREEVGLFFCHYVGTKGQIRIYTHLDVTTETFTFFFSQYAASQFCHQGLQVTVVNLA